MFLAFNYCRFCVVIWFFHPRHNGQWPPTSKDFLSQILSITFFFPIVIFEKEPVFPFQCWVLNKGTTGTIFITYLVWRGPWLGIEPWTSRTRSQHSTTRLSRRRCLVNWFVLLLFSWYWNPWTLWPDKDDDITEYSYTATPYSCVNMPDIFSCRCALYQGQGHWIHGKKKNKMLHRYK